MKDIDLFEVNEAFASVVMTLGARCTSADMDKVNVNGGAIAIGHPVGLDRQPADHDDPARARAQRRQPGLVSMCCGGALATGTIISAPVVSTAESARRQGRSERNRPR